MASVSMLWVPFVTMLRSPTAIVVGAVFGFIALIAAALFVGFGGRSNVRNLYQHGRHVLGRVTSATTNQRGLTSVSYEYEADGNDHTYSGKFSTTDALALQGVERGSTVSVFYAANRPSRSTGLLPRELPPADDA